MSEQKPSEMTTKSAGAAKPGGGYNNPGWAQMRSTSAFRAINFELFVKPNKWVMGFGLITLSGIVGYLGYMRAKAENQSEMYTAMNENEEFSVKKRPSRWD